MKKLKKLLTLICVGTLVAVMAILTACGGSTGTKGGTTPGGDGKTPTTTVSVKLDKSTLALEAGATGTLTVTVTGSTETPTVDSSNKAAATASIGTDKKTVTVTAVAAGTSTVTVNVGEAKATCTVTVTAPAKALSLSLSYIMLEDSAESELDNYVTVKYNGSETVTATVADPTIATVAYANGKATLTALKTGKTKLTVTAGEDTAECAVEVATYGLEYEYQVATDDDGNESYYMQVSATDKLTAANVYIPGYAYDVDADEYFPVTRIKESSKNAGGGLIDGTGAFEGVKSGEGDDATYSSPIETVYTGDNVGVIAAGAFRHCESLESVKLGPVVTVIDMYAFDSCTSLTEIEWSPVIKTINRVAFCNSAFVELELPETIDFIGDGTFMGSTSLKKVKINGPVKTIYGGTFQRCQSLEEVWLPAEVTEILNLAFYTVGPTWGEGDWRDDILQGKETKLYFAGKRDVWEKLLQAALDGKTNTFLNTEYNTNLTVYCADDNDPKILLDKTEVEVSVHSDPVVITATAKNIEEPTITAESSDTAVATVTVDGMTVTVTPVAAGTATVTVTCGELTATCTVTFNELILADTPNVMVGVGNELKLKVADASATAATVGSESIATATVAGGIVTITGVANGSTTVTVGEATCTVWVGTTGLTYEVSGNGEYLILAGSTKQVDNLYVPGYATIDNVNYLPIKEIKERAFVDGNDSKFVSIFTGDNVETIGDNAFHNNNDTNFASIKMGAALKVIGTRAFDDNENTTVTLDWGESQPTTIGNEAFAWCGIKTVVVPKSVTSLGQQAFWNCNLETVYILCDNLDNIGTFTFMCGNSSITLYISSGVKAIANNAIRSSDGPYNNVTVYYEGTEAEYNTLIATANGGDGHCYNTLRPGNTTHDEKTANTTVNYGVDFSNL